MIMEESNRATKKLGIYRKELYGVFEGIVGRQMTEEEHSSLKEVMVKYVEANSERPILPSEPKEHIYVCGNCGGRTRGNGRKFKRNMNRSYKKDNEENV